MITKNMEHVKQPCQLSKWTIQIIFWVFCVFLLWMVLKACGVAA